MPDREGSEDESSPQIVLSRRLNLLLDVDFAERGRPMTFPELQEQLAQRGVTLSRARWSYMKEGTGPLVSDARVLAAICDVFGVDASYLQGGPESALPDRIESQLEFVRALRAARVRAFAARTLGGVSPETLRVISDYLNRDIQRHPAGTETAVNPPTDTDGERPTTL